jgi:hypothetical protein
MKSGDYVRCNFPFREFRGPGPSPHIVLVLATDSSAGERFALVAYTSTRISFEGARRPRQYMLVDEARATILGQARPFHVDVSRLARLPITFEYFPDLTNDVATTYGRDRAMVDKVAKRIQELQAEGHQITPVDLSPRKSPGSRQ